LLSRFGCAGSSRGSCGSIFICNCICICYQIAERGAMHAQRGLIAAARRDQLANDTAMAARCHEAARRARLAEDCETAEANLVHALQRCTSSQHIQHSINMASKTGLVAPRLLQDAQHRLCRSTKRDMVRATRQPQCTLTAHAPRFRPLTQFRRREAEAEEAPEPELSPPAGPRMAEGAARGQVPVAGGNVAERLRPGLKVRGLGERLERVVTRRGLLQKEQPPGAGRSRLAQAKQQQLCLEFAQRGRCTHGTRCVFAHGAHQLADPPEQPKGDEQPPEPRKASAAVDALFAQRLAAARLACADSLAATHALEEGQLQLDRPEARRLEDGLRAYEEALALCLPAAEAGVGEAGEASAVLLVELGHALRKAGRSSEAVSRWRQAARLGRRGEAAAAARRALLQVEASLHLERGGGEARVAPRAGRGGVVAARREAALPAAMAGEYVALTFLEATQAKAREGAAGERQQARRARAAAAGLAAGVVGAQLLHEAEGGEGGRRGARRTPKALGLGLAHKALVPLVEAKRQRLLFVCEGTMGGALSLPAACLLRRHLPRDGAPGVPAVADWAFSDARALGPLWRTQRAVCEGLRQHAVEVGPLAEARCVEPADFGRYGLLVLPAAPDPGPSPGPAPNPDPNPNPEPEH